MVRFGMTAALASTLNQTFAAGKSRQASSAIRSCVFIMLYGGPSQLDTWDMKPLAPTEVRGDYRSISTNIPGRVVCEHLERCAQRMDRLAVIRSMHHAMANHNSAMYQALVGRPPRLDLDVLGAQRSDDFPCVGAALSYLLSRSQSDKAIGTHNLAHVALPHVMHNVVDLPGQNAGFLGGRFDPLQVTSDPNHVGFQVPDLQMALPTDRTQSRLHLLHRLETSAATAIDDGWQAYRERAYDLMHNPQIQRAFRLDEEPASLRDRYGRHTLGQSMLLARKLVESQVRFINVHDKVYNGQDANWDSHQTIFPRHRELLLPFDQAFSALLDDLQERGLLESTLVVVAGEFGRTPRVNVSAGRDHWPDCYSVVLAGGGVIGGSTYGESDRFGAYPLSNGVTPADLLATILWRFGFDPHAELRDPLGRPLAISEGAPIRSLFSVGNG